MDFKKQKCFTLMGKRQFTGLGFTVLKGKDI